MSSLAALAAAFALSACGGGGSAAGPITPPGVGGGTGGGGTTTAAATVAVSFVQYQPVTPSGAKRSTAFISPATHSLTLSVISGGGVKIANPAVTTLNVGATNAGCTSAGLKITCAATLDAPVGNDVVSIASYAAANGTGTQLSTTLAPMTVVANATNVVPLALNGTIASLEVLLDNGFTLGHAGTARVLIVPLDASGAQIVNPGNYNPPIVVTSSDTSGAFSLIFDGTASGNSATVGSPNDQVVLGYNGSGTTSVTTNVVATAGTISGAASARAGGQGLGGALTGAGATGPSPQRFIFSAPGQSGALVVSGGTAPYTVTSDTPSVATESGTSPSFTIAAAGVGTANLTVTDAASSHFTIPVIVEAPPIAIAVVSQGTAATCTTSTVSFPQGATPSPQETCTIALSGGNGSYSYYFATSGTATSQYATVTHSASDYTITPTGAGNDTVVFTSASATAPFGIVTGSPLAAALPASIGMLVMQNTGGVGKAFSLTVPATVTSVTQTSGATDNNLQFNNHTVSATPMTPGVGSLHFVDSLGNVADVPFTLFGVTFSSDAGTNIGNPGETATDIPADEQFTGLGEVDHVTVPIPLGTGFDAVTPASSNTNVVSVTSTGATSFDVTSVGAGTATIALTDGDNHATVSYAVSVTTTTIPIAGREHTR